MVTAIKPLYLEVSYDSHSGTGYMINVERQAMVREDKRHTSTFVSRDNKSELITWQDVKGPPDNPTELDLVWKETGEPIVITPTKPFRRVDGYMLRI